MDIDLQVLLFVTTLVAFSIYVLVKKKNKNKQTLSDADLKQFLEVLNLDAEKK